MKFRLALIIIFISVISLLFISGCAASNTTENIEILPADRLVKRLEANRRKIKSIEANGTLTVKTSDFNNSASFRIIVQKPDSICLTIMGPFGIELAQALVTKKNFIFYDAMNNTAYKGLANDDIIKNIFKINLSFNDLLDAFIGSVNLTERLYKSPSHYEIEYDKYLLTYIDSTSMISSKYKIDIKNLGISNFIIQNKQNKILMEADYSNFNIIENVAVPFNISLTNKLNNQYLNIEYSSFNANKKNVRIDFQLPADANVIEW